MDLDVKEPDQVERMFGKVTERLGPVDILVNNAGVCYHRLAAEVPREEWLNTSTSTSTGYGIVPRRWESR